jgi:hypothetical protein
VAAPPVEITNGTIRGPSPTARYQPAYEEWAGIKLGTQRNDGVPVRAIWVHDLTIRNVFGDFINLSAGTAAEEHLSDVLIEDNVMTVAGRQGIVVNGGTNLVIRHNDVRNTAHVNFDAEPKAGQGFQGVLISENTGNASQWGYFKFSGPNRAVASDLTSSGTRSRTAASGEGGWAQARPPRAASSSRTTATSGPTATRRASSTSTSSGRGRWDEVTIHHSVDRLRPERDLTAVDLEDRPTPQ